MLKKRPDPTDSLLPLHIESMAVGGSGVGRIGQMVVFVPGAAPNEDLLIRIQKKKKNFAIGEIHTLVKPSPYRRTPPCPVVHRCGGCNWQHFDESEQLKQKKLIVESTLKKFVKEISIPESTIKASPRSLRYRNRIQPKYQNGKMGFFERNTYKIVETSDCLLAEESLSEAWNQAKKWASQQTPLSKKSGSKFVDPTVKFEMKLTTENEVQFSLVDSQSSEGTHFSQVNRFQNLDLIDCVLEMSALPNMTRIIDLYAGSGNFSIPLAKTYSNKNILAIELSKKLVSLGRSESNKLSINNLEFQCSDVDLFLKSTNLNKSDLIILDPPRTGCSPEIMKQLAAHEIKNIIYISCHPVTLARDLKDLKDWNLKLHQKSIKIQDLKIFEMFPQTDHVETIVRLEIDS